MNTTDALLMAAFGGKKTVIIPRKAINLLDIKGNVFKAYEKAEFLRLTELPAPPSADGFTPKGWNFTLPEAKAAVEANGKLDVAPSYETDDGKTHIFITLHEGKLSPRFGLCVNGSVDIDWGDGSDHSTLTGTSLSTYVYIDRTWPAPGDYEIVLDVTGTVSIVGDKSYYYTNLLWTGSSYPAEGNRVYSSTVKKVYIGNNVVIGDYAFAQCFYLEEITIPDTVLSFGTGAFYNCYSLQNVAIPSGFASISDRCFFGCRSFSSISFPHGITSIGYNACYAWYGLSNIVLPDTVTNIGDAAFGYGYSLCPLIIPDSVTNIGQQAFMDNYSAILVIGSGVESIGASAFMACSGLQEVHLKPTTPPTLGSNAFLNVPNTCLFYVPAESFEAYKAASGWSNFASAMRPEFSPTDVPITSYRVDFNGGFVANGQWVYDVGDYRCDIYRVDAGQKYIISLGDVVGNRFRVMFTTTDVTEVTENVTGTSVVHKDNPAAGDAVVYTAPENGYLVIQKTNQGTDGIETIVYKMSA